MKTLLISLTIFIALGANATATKPEGDEHHRDNSSAEPREIRVGNPIKKNLKIFNAKEGDIIDCYDLSGHLVFEEKYSEGFIKDVSTFQSGAYLLTIMNKDFRQTQRIIIAK